MRPNATVQRKCLHCGFIYDTAEMWRGIKRCPNCWIGEKFVYVNSQGKEMPKGYKPHLESIDEDIRTAYKDTGCPFYHNCPECPYEICAESLIRSECPISKTQYQRLEPKMQKVTA